jgi:hypothetical protein
LYLDPITNKPPIAENSIRALILGPNDGGAKRGDRSDTGDEEAAPNILDYDLPAPEDEELNTFEDNPDPDENDMEILTPYNSRSGVTNIGGRPADDWAADTGPTQTSETIRE